MKPAGFLDEWDMPLNDGYAYLTKLFGSYLLARHELKRALCERQLVAMDWSVERGGNGSKKQELPPDFWQTAKFRFYKNNPHEIHVERYDNSYHHSYFLRWRNVKKLWPANNKRIDAAASAERPLGGKSPAGRKPKYDVKDILIEAAAYMYDSGVPKSLAELCEKIGDRFPKLKSDTSMEDYLRPLYRKFKQIDGK
jgi:hypothetical protein